MRTSRILKNLGTTSSLTTAKSTVFAAYNTLPIISIEEQDLSFCKATLFTPPATIKTPAAQKIWESDNAENMLPNTLTEAAPQPKKTRHTPSRIHKHNEKFDLRTIDERIAQAQALEAGTSMRLRS